nr:NUDIX domain-containing protein [Murinocardiopsis flavida]
MSEGVHIADEVDIPRVDDGRTWVAGAVVIDGAGRAFTQRRSLQRRLFPGCWDAVGGHVEPGETMVAALRREIAEETGWTLTHILAEIHRLVWTPADGVARHEVDYLVRVDGDLDRPALEPGKHTEYAWIDESRLGVLETDRDPGDAFLLDIYTGALRAARRLGA